MIKPRLGTFLTSIAIAAAFAGCESTTAPPPPPPPVPAAVITVSGNGDIEVHPSIDRGFGAAVVFPVQIMETAGGTAIWNYFRISYYRRGAEIERYEWGASDIQASGYRDIASRASITADVVTRVNSTDWDDVQIQLGFIDNRDARVFEQALTLVDFDGVVLDLTPVLLPEGRSFAIIATSDQ